MNRRELLILGIGASLLPKAAVASGHNGFCELRDSGGAFLPEKQILVRGYAYETYRAQALLSAKPQTVLVEDARGYRSAIQDARSGRLPPGSIAVFDRSRFPEGVIGGFHEKIGKTSVYFNIPETLQEARYVHGERDFQSGVSDERLEASLPELRWIAAQYKADGATKIEPRMGLSAADWLTAQIGTHRKNDLIILASHVSRSSVELASPSGILSRYPTGQLPLIDGSVFKLEKAVDSGPTVWTVGCETWDLELGRLSLEKSELAFTTKISYPESLLIVRKLRRGETLFEKINRLQADPWVPQRLPESHELQAIDENHPLPGPPRNMAVVAEVVQDKNILLVNKMTA
ncbi:hypothetical protein [Bradyrhizobium liaoningense]|uniref:hypothetical protein n=1 Tax=Bradyrhizobium liaoningense TaxID=43992 RepID=UPI001BAB83A6|nr:hypothetical protein [Bradyrhizobium liaoningense]MBR1068855.1 hypothetical protein [Bradyrhizobium liaoningense]